MSAAPLLIYDHECAPPPKNVEAPGRRRWYCPDCGDLWFFAVGMQGRQRVGVWREVSRVGEIQRLRRQLADVRAYATGGVLPRFYAAEILRRLEGTDAP